jgi:hypothetical protein
MPEPGARVDADERGGADIRVEDLAGFKHRDATRDGERSGDDDVVPRVSPLLVTLIGEELVRVREDDDVCLSGEQRA